MNQYLAVTSNGMENLLVEELTKLGIENAKPVQAGVKFKATNEQIYRCCLWSRLASRFVRVYLNSLVTTTWIYTYLLRQLTGINSTVLSVSLWTLTVPTARSATVSLAR